MDFREKLATGEILLFDGATGSELTAKGVDDQAGEINLLHPRQVREVHRSYIEVGADCIITNTLVLNEIYLAKKGRLHVLDDAVRAGAELALEAADGRAFVFGDIGPIGVLLAPYGPGEANAFYEAFCRQASVLAELPIDGFIIETVYHLAEAELILKACREVAPRLPIICSLTFDKTNRGGRTIMGDGAVDIAAKAKELGADVVGANCGELTPLELADVLRNLGTAGLPLSILPNAGKPRLEKGQVYYDLGPAQFAEQMLACREAGAQLLGGCCGTTPAHIAALAAALGR